MEIPYEVTPRRDTGLYNAKLGVWLFLASEVMLFGGLFSAYVFLRVGVQDGVDNPWPWGLNVHKDYVWLGFINTLVLIFSSVGVVFAWVALKERNWRRFQAWMYIVVVCAAVFMCIKGVEYNSKLNKHHGIKLMDNSVMEGKIKDKTDQIRFDATEVSFSLQGGIPIFLESIDGEFPTMKLEVGEGEDEVTIESESEFKKWFFDARRQTARDLVDERKRYRGEIADGIDAPTPVSVSTSATLVSSEPFKVRGNPRKVVAHTDDAINFRDGTKVTGKLTGDDVIFEVHEVDLQLVLPQNQRDALVWEVIDDEQAKKEFFAEQHRVYEEIKEYFDKKGEIIPEKMLRGHMLNLHYVHLGHGGEHHEDDGHKGGKENGEGHEGGDGVHSSESKPSAKEADLHFSKDHVAITVPRDKIKFMGNHGPRYGNYYALYFTMTALHGLHVIGGALVLLYFVVFGKRIYRKNPEHLANRVEVGGLFWHFVDLIWIFLFPLMYLL